MSEYIGCLFNGEIIIERLKSDSMLPFMRKYPGAIFYPTASTTESKEEASATIMAYFAKRTLENMK